MDNEGNGESMTWKHHHQDSFAHFCKKKKRKANPDVVHRCAIFLLSRQLTNPDADNAKGNGDHGSDGEHEVYLLLPLPPAIMKYVNNDLNPFARSSCLSQIYNTSAPVATSPSERPRFPAP